MHPGGPSRMKWSLKLTRGNMNMGGIMFPNALPAHATVTSVPLSPEVTSPEVTVTYLKILFCHRPHCPAIIAHYSSS